MMQCDFEKVYDILSNDTELLLPLKDLYESGLLDRALERYQSLYELYVLEGYDEPVAPFLNRYAQLLEGLERTDEALDVYRRAADADLTIETYDNAQDLLLMSVLKTSYRSFASVSNATLPSTRGTLCVRAGRFLWRELRRAQDARPLLDEASEWMPDDSTIRKCSSKWRQLSDWPLVAQPLAAQLDAASPSEACAAGPSG